VALLQFTGKISERVERVGLLGVQVAGEHLPGVWNRLRFHCHAAPGKMRRLSVPVQSQVANLPHQLELLDPDSSGPDGHVPCHEALFLP
jgi:hypothetical protein